MTKLELVDVSHAELAQPQTEAGAEGCLNVCFVCSSSGRDLGRFVEAVGGGCSKGGQFMTWSGMQSPFGGEPQGLYTRGKLYTSSRKLCQSPPGCCRGGLSL